MAKLKLLVVFGIFSRSVLAVSSGNDEKSSNFTSTDDLLPAWINPWVNLPRSRQFTITCCDNSWPKPNAKVVPHMIEFKVEDLGSVSYDSSCHRFNGQLLLPPNIIQQYEKYLEISCNCTNPHADRNCRNLPPCENAGYRSFSIQLRCVCPPKWFGPLCENYCLNGQLVKDDRQIDQCVCDKNYFGPNCDEIYCNNGGTPAQGNRHCACLMGFFGRFCEGFLNTTRLGSAEIGRRDNFSRDISSSAVSLLLVVLVGFIIYFLVRRRTNRLRMQMRQLAAARQNLATDNQDFIQSQFNGVDGLDPPSYTVAISTPASDMSHFHAEQMLPPPSYDDIVKENLPGTPKPNTASATPPPQLSHQK